MQSNRFRAWRFTHPDFDVGDGETGIGTDVSGGIAMIEDIASVQQSIKLLLTIRPGERVMRPGYGCRLHELAFAPNDDTTAGLAMHLVRQAIRRWEPRVDILDIDATRNDAQPSRLNIVLDYRVRPHLTHHQLALPVNLMPTES